MFVRSFHRANLNEKKQQKNAFGFSTLNWKSTNDKILRFFPFASILLVTGSKSHIHIHILSYNVNIIWLAFTTNTWRKKILLYSSLIKLFSLVNLWNVLQFVVHRNQLLRFFSFLFSFAFYSNLCTFHWKRKSAFWNEKVFHFPHKKLKKKMENRSMFSLNTNSQVLMIAIPLNASERAMKTTSYASVNIK